MPPMRTLSAVEARILGVLVEKELTTPDQYPLTLNALVNACNQKNNRDPIVAFDEKTVSDALERLRTRNLVYVFYGSSARVPKYKHMLPSVYELEPSETAVMAVNTSQAPRTTINSLTKPLRPGRPAEEKNTINESAA